MEITAVINTHGHPDVTLDTVDSIRNYMTEQCLLVVDGAAWGQFESLAVPVPMLRGFCHNYFKAPYRNVALGLLMAADHWPRSDWVCYLEYDCLIGSAAFQKDLIQAEKDNIWCLGADYRDRQEVSLPLIEKILKTQFTETVYLLGAVLFFHKRFMEKAAEVDFFRKFLTYTNEFKDGFMPGYGEWDVSEHLLPTLARHWGGGVRQLSKWSQKIGVWTGNSRRYPIRWRPDLEEYEKYLGFSIAHPIKDFLNPLRVFHRDKRAKKNERRF